MRRIVVVALLAFLAGAGTYRLATKTIPQDFWRAAATPTPVNPYYDVRRGQFAIAKVPPSPVVMLGDSITEQGLWSELTGCQNIINRGIGSDTTAGGFNRIGDDVIALHPLRVYYLFGANDVIKSLDLNSSAENLRAIGRILAEHKIEAVRFSTLPVTGRYAKFNSDINRLNDLVGDKPISAGIEPSDISYDDIHLLASGYRKIANKILCN